jgi:hypothetical protein
MAAIFFTQCFHYFMKFPLNFHQEIHIKNISGFFQTVFGFNPEPPDPTQLSFLLWGEGGRGKVKI